VRGRTLIALAGVAAVAGIAQAATSGDEVGPDTKVQPSGRRLAPVGKQTDLGNFPAGAALTPNGRFLWTLSAGRGKNDIRIVEVQPALKCKSGARGKSCRSKRKKRVGRIVQTIPMPGVSGGVAMSPESKTVYVSGTPNSPYKDQTLPDSTPGAKGEVIHVFSYDSAKGTAKQVDTIPVPVPDAAPVVQSFPPETSKKLSWPRDLAVSRDGKTLLAALNLADHAAIVDLEKKAVRYVPTGNYPYGAAITRDGKGLVSNEGDGTVSVIDLKSGSKTKDLQVGPNLSHPESIAYEPRQHRAFVAVANNDTVAVIDTDKMEVERTLSVARPEGIGTAPINVSVTRDGKRLLVSDSGEDAIAVFDLPSFKLIGRVPVGSYPVAALSDHRRSYLTWVSGKGIGVGPNRNGPNPSSPNDSDDGINSFQYLPSILRGRSGILRFPTDAEIRKLTPIADRQLVPVNAQTAPAGSPIVPPSAPGGGKIKHVFYIVRENRTYDQVLGDDERGNGDPALTLFGKEITPNYHALARRFPLLDHVFANSEASIDGHFWTSAIAVSDYTTKSWMQNYGGRGRPYDFAAYSITWPGRRFMFDQAMKQGISFFNYGEVFARVVPFPDKTRDSEETAAISATLQSSDIGPPDGCYPNVASSGGKDVVLAAARQDVDVYDSSLPAGARPNSESRFECFRARFLSQTATSSVPQFTYITLPNNHTSTTSPGRRTPRAMIAENDYALGQMVDLISKSPVWSSSMILVMEDDAQDGADHIDAHRIPALALSPYARRGAVVHTRYDFPSLARTLQIPIGMDTLNLNDAHAVPLFDAFGPDPENIEPYDVIPPTVNLTETNPTTGALARAARRLPVDATDRIPQREMDRLLWKYMRGAGAKPPPPGPNASGRDEAEAEADGGG
jgi:DNA-binding beta-propeller fold protein YncE